MVISYKLLNSAAADIPLPTEEYLDNPFWYWLLKLVQMVQTLPTYPFPYSRAAQLDSRIKIPRPVIDPALAPIIDSFLLPEEVDLEFMRGLAVIADGEGYTHNADGIVKSAPNIKHDEYHVLGPNSDRVTLSVFTPKHPTSNALPALYHIHGGGMIAGDRFSGVAELLGIIKSIECVIISVEYRLAPETQAPGPAEDCYAGLIWASENATTIGIDPAKIVIWGISGGAALTAAMCLMARDRKIPVIPIKGQMLLSPMLDDRCDTISDQQFEYGSPWCGISNRMAWDYVIGRDRGSNSVSPYQSPSRAENLADLPSTYIDAAECEVFRDPAVSYATNMWRCGSTCELHIWPGTFHLFDGTENPNVSLIHAAVSAKRTWIKRILMC